MDNKKTDDGLVITTLGKFEVKRSGQVLYRTVLIGCGNYSNIL